VFLLKQIQHQAALSNLIQLERTRWHFT